MEFSVRHFISGRIRLHLPSLCRKQKLAEAAVAWLESQPGVKLARMNYACASLVIEYDPSFEGVLRGTLGRLSLMSLNDLRLLFDAGKNAQVGGQPAPLPRPVPKPSIWSRTPLALPTVSLLMAFSLNPVVRAVNMPLMLWNAYPIALRAWRVWRREGRINVDLLDTLAIVASLIQGSHDRRRHRDLADQARGLDPRFDRGRLRRAIGELLEFQFRMAWVIRDNVIMSVPASQLAVDDHVVVYPGDVIPVDGEIIDGHAMIDQKTITGEGLPIMRGKGEAVFAATVIRDGQLTVRAIRVGASTTAGQIAQLVESAPIGDTRMQNHAEKFADRLVAPTLGLAVGTAALTADFNRFLSLVIVDYGTGIRVSAPTAVLASMTHAARAGIIIKSGAHMERLAQVDTLIFDKTGTLTHGAPVVLDVISYEHGVTERHLLGLAAAAETQLQAPGRRALSRQGPRKLGANIPYLRANPISNRSWRRRSGEWLLPACRQRAVHAAERHQYPLCGIGSGGP